MNYASDKDGLFWITYFALVDSFGLLKLLELSIEVQMPRELKMMELFPLYTCGQLAIFVFCVAHG